MKNKTIEQAILECDSEFENLSIIIDSIGALSKMSKYLTRYALIRACGTIEYSAKTLIADALILWNPKLSKYVDKRIRESSINPSFQNILSLLTDYDESWSSQFKIDTDNLELRDKTLSSLNSLNRNRNDFAHGKSINASFQEIREYYTDAKEIIIVLDMVVSS